MSDCCHPAIRGLAAAGKGKLEPSKSDIFNRAQFYEVTVASRLLPLRRCYHSCTGMAQH